MVELKVKFSYIYMCISSIPVLFGRKLGMSKEGWPSQKRFKLILNPRHALVHPRELTDMLQNNHRHFSNSMHPKHTVNTN